MASIAKEYRMRPRDVLDMDSWELAVIRIARAMDGYKVKKAQRKGRGSTRS